MEYTDNFNYEDECFYELKPNISQDIYLSTQSGGYNTNIEEKSGQIKAISPPLISSNNSSSSSGGFVISFSSNQEEDIGAMISSENACQESLLGGNYNNNVMYKRSPVQAQDHVIAERKRREKLGDLFISLSKIVPGLKKVNFISFVL